MGNNGFPHYKNSTASMKNWEPVYHNTFNVLITPPANVGFEFVLEEITDVTGLETDQTPGAEVSQIYKGATRRFASNLPGATTIDVNLNFNVNLNDSNSMYVYKSLRSWCDLVWDPLTGGRVLKKDYVGGPMVVSLYNRIGDVTRQWIMPVIWPTTNLPAQDLSYADGTTIYALSMTFAADYWEDISK